MGKGDAVADDRRDFAVLISFATKEEADVAASALHAGGIDAVVGNGHYANLEWGHVLAMNGVQLLTPRARLAEAKAAIRERLAAGDELGREDYARRRDRWKFWVIILGWFAFVFGLPALLRALA